MDLNEFGYNGVPDDATKYDATFQLFLHKGK